MHTAGRCDQPATGLSGAIRAAPRCLVTYCGRSGSPASCQGPHLRVDIMTSHHRRRQIAILGSAEPGSVAYERAGQAGELLARLGIIVVSGCGSPATRVAAERALAAGGTVVSIIPAGDMPDDEWPATIVVPCGMGDARNLLMALAGDACIVIGGRAGTISEVCFAWLHRRPLLPLVGCGGWSDGLERHPPDERGNSPILPWGSQGDLERQVRALGLLPAR